MLKGLAVFAHGHASALANIDGVNFESVPGEKKRSFVKKDDGLYAITRGFSILLR